MEIKGRSIDTFLRAPPPSARAVLIHGEDAGLVRERADQIARAIVPDLADPFRVVDFSPSDLTDDPARLADEAAAIAMLGGRRVIRVRRAGDGLAGLFQRFLGHAVGDALVVVEAGILPKRSSLRQAFETSDAAAAIACYADGPSAIEDLVLDMARAQNLRVEPEAMELLTRSLGGDRLATRNELDKLSLYLGPSARAITRADVIACLSETAEAETDDIVDAAAEGDATTLDRLINKAFQAGAAPIMLVRAAQGHVTRLHLLAAQAQRGGAVEGLVRGLKPGLPFPRVDRVIRQVRAWTPQRLAEMIQLLNDAEIQCKTTGMPDEAIAARALMGIALRARAR